MFRSILVPLDGTSEAEAAIPLARCIAAASDGLVRLVRVASEPDSGIAARYVDGLARDTRNGHVHVYGVVRSGDPATEIVKYSRLQHTDLIVMTTRAVGSRSILALTSVARHVVSESPAPVLLVHPASDPPRQISSLLVPVDGSPGGALALAAARALAHATGARIVVLEVVTPVPAAALAALPGMTVGGYIDPDWESLAVSTAHTYVEGLADSLGNGGLRAQARVRTGDVVAEILQCADEVGADLVVMGTHSVAWPARAFQGSVADRVLRESKHPVLLVRREHAAGDATDDHD